MSTISTQIPEVVYSVDRSLVWLDWPQFKAFQSMCSGAQLGETIEASEAWVYQRNKEVDPENGWPYCGYGLGEVDLPNEEGVDAYVRAAWYYTTSGTLLVVAKLLNPYGEEDGPEVYGVEIPEHREGGFHAMLLDLALTGVTGPQWKTWYSGGASYQDRVDYWKHWTEHMVPRGWEPRMHPRTREVEWIAESLIRDIEHSVSRIFNGGEDYDQTPYHAKEILREWERAHSRMISLLGPLAGEYDEDYDDYSDEDYEDYDGDDYDIDADD
jgi:hypothetical protein